MPTIVYRCLGEGSTGEAPRETRLAHSRGAIRTLLEEWTRGSPVAVETVGNWYWPVDEIEASGMVPRLVHARKVKLTSGMINNTDGLHARGFKPNATDRNAAAGITPADVRDQRDLPRTRMVLVNTRTQPRHRITYVGQIRIDGHGRE
jgi:hypothetical protein